MQTAPHLARLSRRPQAAQKDSIRSHPAKAAAGSGVSRHVSSTSRTIRTFARAVTWRSISRISSSASIAGSAWVIGTPRAIRTGPVGVADALGPAPAASVGRSGGESSRRTNSKSASSAPSRPRTVSSTSCGMLA